MSKKKTTKKKANEHYSTSKWHGLPMFKCSRCPWSTMDEDEMTRHIAKHLSGEVRKTQTVKTGLVGPGGGDIVKIVDAEVEPEEGDTHG